MRVFLAVSLSLAIVGTSVAESTKDTVVCTDEMLQNADNALAKVSIELLKICGDASGGIDVTRSLKDTEGRGLDCGFELKRLQDWNQKIQEMKNTGICPKSCVSCAILNPDTNGPLDDYLAKMVDRKTELSACSEAEKELNTPKKCVLDLFETLTPTGLLQGKSNCAVEAVNGVIQDLFSNVEAFWDLGKMAYGGAKSLAVNAWKSWWPANDKISDANHAASAQSDSTLQEIGECPSCFIKKVGVAMGEMMNEAIKTNFGCGRWDSGIPHVGTCVEPMKNWDCASCAQKSAAICGVAGFVAGEIVTSFVLTGGTSLAAKVLIKTGGKVAEVVGKNVIRAVPRAAEIAEGVSKVANAGVSGLKLSRHALGSRWSRFMSTPLGRSLLVSSHELRAGATSSLEALQAIPGLAKTAHFVTYPLRSYLDLMQRAGVCGWEQGSRLGDKVGDSAVRFIEKLEKTH